MSTTTAARPAPPKTSVKETLTSLIIAFAMAFVFRGFVMEAFVIPTGSMAPTLNGAHMRFKSPQSGFEWAVKPHYFVPKYDSQSPAPLQGGMTYIDPITNERLAQDPTVDVNDPMTLAKLEGSKIPPRWGDRVFVMKYLYSVYDPQRWDVIVFKNPTQPTVNYIKRLIGLPGEQVALVDGDVFVRTPRADDDRSIDPWSLPGWTIATKPRRAQDAMWQPVFSSEFAPVAPERDGRTWFRSPWIAIDPATGERPKSDKDAGWEIGANRVYTYTGQRPTGLAWDESFRPIIDSYWYNQGPRSGYAPNQPPQIGFPVSDLRLAAGVVPSTADQTVRAYVHARDHAFEAQVHGKDAVLRMRRTTGLPPGPATPWTELAHATLPAPLAPGKVTNITFEHADQTLRLLIDDREVLSAPYAWSPAERIQFATGLELAQIEATPLLLTDRARYSTPRAGFEFEGGPVTLHRVALARDIFYQPATYSQGNDPRSPHSKFGTPAGATHPTTVMRLTRDQFFVCGDNSPESLDARLWDKPNPWVEEIDPTMGVVNRDLLIGKAFFVYLPSPGRIFEKIPIPDFGRMRFIW